MATKRTLILTALATTVAILLFTVPIYQKSIDITCGERGTIRRSLIQGHSKATINQESEDALLEDAQKGCARQEGTATYKLYVL